MTDSNEPTLASKHLRDLVAGNVEEALERHGHPDDDLHWDVAWALVPTQQGMAMSSFLVVSMRSPLIGQSGLTVHMQVDVLALRDSELAQDVVLKGLLALRDLRAQLLATPPPPATL